MADFEYLSLEDLEKITKVGFEDFSKNIIGDSASKVKTIQTYLYNFLNLIEVERRKNKHQGGTYYILKNFKNNNNDVNKRIMLVGGRLVFLLRSFLTGEKIDFLLGGSDANNTSLYVVKEEQDTILTKLQSNMKEECLELESSLFSLKSLENSSNKFEPQMKDFDFQSIWQQILNLADYTKISYSNYLFPPITLDNHEYYGKLSQDFDVFISYRTSETGMVQKYGYYYKNKKMINYNKGWLFQWYLDTILQNHIDNLTRGLSEGKLNYLIQGTENIPGYQGGDSFIMNNNESQILHQYQIKYQNQTVISYTSIVTVLQRLQLALSTYNYEKEYLTKERIKRIAKIFANKNLPKINKGYQKRLEDLLGSFQKKNEI